MSNKEQREVCQIWSACTERAPMAGCGVLERPPARPTSPAPGPFLLTRSADLTGQGDRSAPAETCAFHWSPLPTANLIKSASPALHPAHRGPAKARKRATPPERNMVARRCWFCTGPSNPPARFCLHRVCQGSMTAPCLGISTETGNDLLTSHSPNVPADKLDALIQPRTPQANRTASSP
jgi:hypothetical protein